MNYREIKDMTLEEKLIGAAEAYSQDFDESDCAFDDFIEGANWMKEAMEIEDDELVQ